MSYWKEVAGPCGLVNGQRIRFYDRAGSPDESKVGMVGKGRHWGSNGCGTSDGYPFGAWRYVEAMFEDDGTPAVKSGAATAWSASDPHTVYTVDDWKYEVANGDTQRGYREWVEACVERDGAE